MTYAANHGQEALHGACLVGKRQQLPVGSPSDLLFPHQHCRDHLSILSCNIQVRKPCLCYACVCLCVCIHALSHIHVMSDTKPPGQGEAHFCEAARPCCSVGAVGADQHSSQASPSARRVSAQGKSCRVTLQSKLGAREHF